ncbi:uncharacterized protein LOC121381669 [Gigantopelta aegis]|uniref:uncharacterized protein LOC121381669 n=1 Tax=Gigantopelta aegis TaxID=1735272 RepID=UPI001B88A1FD|nr:uncharacterized protein LOC121381669 [Gigantopelta aegis]
MINKLANYRVFTRFDLKSAYHQIPIKASDKKYTGFEANGKLYQFCRIPFGVTNGVAVFQRQMDKLVVEEGLKDTFPYLDDITIAGRNQSEHDINLKAFLDMVERRKLTLNDSKSIISTRAIKILGYLIEEGPIKPDPERLFLFRNFHHQRISPLSVEVGDAVAYISRTLQNSELRYPAVEKDATAITEAVRKWSHFLMRRPFTLITDQRSVAFMLDNRRRTKVKNNKIQGWRLELSSFSYSIKYRPGKDNVAPDTFTRAFCASATTSSNLSDIHIQLCHPGVTRLLHFVRSKNLPYSTDDVRRVCASCKICAELKPQFFRPPTATPSKATQPMERLSVDFKGPLPSSTRNTYILTIIDEYSRFPFAFPCPNVNTATIIQCFNQLFALCGTPNFIHSDRGASFMSQELKTYLSEKGIATSRTTPYHPNGNGQVERFNGIIWKSIRLGLKSHNLPDSNWEVMVPEALHSIRSLLSTSTNTTPHERFFKFQRRSPSGTSLPSWLSVPGKVMLRRFVRHTKMMP